MVEEVVIDGQRFVFKISDSIKEKRNISDIERVCIIPYGLGDCIITTPLARVLKKLNPLIKVYYLVNKDWQQLLCLPYVDNVYGYDDLISEDNAEKIFIDNAEMIMDMDVFFFPGSQIPLRRRITEAYPWKIIISNIVDDNNYQYLQGALTIVLWEENGLYEGYGRGLALLLPFTDFPRENLCSKNSFTDIFFPLNQSVVQDLIDIAKCRKIVYINPFCRGSLRLIPHVAIQQILNVLQNQECLILLDGFLDGYYNDLEIYNSIICKLSVPEISELISKVDFSVLTNSGPSHIAMSQQVNKPSIILYGSATMVDRWRHPDAINRVNVLLSDNVNKSVPYDGLKPHNPKVCIEDLYTGNINVQELCDQVLKMINCVYSF